MDPSDFRRVKAELGSTVLHPLLFSSHEPNREGTYYIHGTEICSMWMLRMTRTKKKTSTFLWSALK